MIKNTSLSHFHSGQNVFIVAAAIISYVLPSATAQVQTATQSKHLAFDVVSIRSTKCDPESKSSFGPTPDGFRITNDPLIGLFQIAYTPSHEGDSGFFRGSRILGAPDWLKRSECFDVLAKITEANMADWNKPASREPMLRDMMRSLLEERLKAVVHIEAKEMPVFDLLIAKGGPKFKLAETSDSKELRVKHPGSIASPDGSVVTPGGGMKQMYFFGASLATLVPIASYLSGRPVEDRTGLTGRYDFTIQMNFNILGPAIDNASAKVGFPVDVLGAPPPPPGIENSSDMPSSVDSEPSIFTALQEQLGLRLEQAKGQVETLVIDHVERPSEN